MIDQRSIRQKCADAVRGLKTLIAAAVFIGLGLADYFDMVNVKPMLDMAFGEDKSAKIMIFLPVIFATLRFITSGKVRWWHDKNEPF